MFKPFCVNQHDFKYCMEAVVPELGGPGGPLAPSIFGRSVNPIQNGGGQIMPTITTGPPKVFHLPASLVHIVQRSRRIRKTKAKA